MDPAVWLAFVGASAILLVIPGPTILLVVAYALGEGRRSATYTVAGTMLGDALAMSVSLLGLGALLATSAELFTIVRLAGAAYLVYLGIRLWRAPPRLRVEGAAGEPRSGRGMLGHAFLVTALNPKSILFFVAFLPQFMTPDRSLLLQAAILLPTFVVLAGLNAGAYALLADRAGRTIRNPRIGRIVNRTGGGFLIGAGLGTALFARNG